jgi:hypothetical protein
MFKNILIKELIKIGKHFKKKSENDSDLEYQKELLLQIKNLINRGVISF